MAKSKQPASFGSMFLMYGGGVAVMYGALALFSLLSGMKLEFGSSGMRGIPFPSSWPSVGLLVGFGVGCYLLGTRWDAPRFLALRQRLPWLVPVVVTFVIVPGLVVLLFAMLQ
ncbi:MAG: hypothetical protein ACPG77_06510 [Nannocystaceae bacterium]